MPYIRVSNCVYKKNKNNKKGKKVGCSKTIKKAKKYLQALYANENESIEEIKDYFNKKQDEDYMLFNNHPLSNIEDLMNDEKPAPWDHLTNTKDDGDVDVEIEDDK
tara:strand:+ start:1943 stop:2260 length:318 start_codon:yes stop_codon:yes gene_type:complete